jgi:AcrR family transcriptional regulator
MKSKVASFLNMFKLFGNLDRMVSMAPTKSELTREKIVNTAMELFRRNGYEKTTMRTIAAEAGMSLGSSYYYFSSKEYLIQGFYAQLEESYEGKVQTILTTETGFAPRLSGALKAWVTTAEPYRDFAGNFFRVAADPKSPLSPFSPESSATRAASTEIFRQVVTGSGIKLSRPMQGQLPEMLWLLHMGVVLFWVFDDSSGSARTFELIDRAVPMVSKLVGLSRVPGLTKMANDVAKMVGDLRARS